MDAASWGALRWVGLLGGSFFVSAYIAISVFFRLGDPAYAAHESILAPLGFMLSGAVAACWLFLLATTAWPQLRTMALVCLAISLLFAMFVPPLLALI